MQRRDLVIGLGVLVVIVGLVLFVQNRQDEVSPIDASPTPSAAEQEQALEERFNVDIPDDVEKANLQGTTGNGIATRDIVGSRTSISTLVDLPDPDAGMFYQAWLINGNDTKLLGSLSAAKGGYLLDVNLTGDQSNFDEVIVSRESVNDSEIETVMLRGSF